MVIKHFVQAFTQETYHTFETSSFIERSKPTFLITHDNSSLGLFGAFKMIFSNVCLVL
jgi:hypothetical protein